MPACRNRVLRKHFSPFLEPNFEYEITNDAKSNCRQIKVEFNIGTEISRDQGGHREPNGLERVGDAKGTRRFWKVEAVESVYLPHREGVCERKGDGHWQDDVPLGLLRTPGKHEDAMSESSHEHQDHCCPHSDLLDHLA